MSLNMAAMKDFEKDDERGIVDQSLGHNKQRQTAAKSLSNLGQVLIASLKGVSSELSAKTVGKNGELLTKVSSTAKIKNTMSQREAAKYLNISKPTLIAREKEGKIVSYRPSVGRVVYLQEDLDAYLKNTTTQK